MEDSLREYVTEKPDADYAALIARFGSPQQIAESGLGEMDSGEILQCMRIRQKVLWFLFTVVTLLFAVRSAFTVLAYVDHVKAVNGHAVVEVIEIERVENPEGDME